MNKRQFLWALPIVVISRSRLSIVLFFISLFNFYFTLFHVLLRSPFILRILPLATPVPVTNECSFCGQRLLRQTYWPYADLLATDQWPFISLHLHHLLVINSRPSPFGFIWQLLCSAARLITCSAINIDINIGTINSAMRRYLWRV